MNTYLKLFSCALLSMVLTLCSDSARISENGVIAASLPKPVTVDSRIKVFVYNQFEVYPLTFHYGKQAHIDFGRDEVITSISMGDSFSWHIEAVGFRLFVQPLEKDVTTNMTVITNKRVYEFDLLSKDNNVGIDRDLVYVVHFFYPPNDIDLDNMRSMAVSFDDAFASRERKSADDMDSECIDLHNAEDVEEQCDSSDHANLRTTQMQPTDMTDDCEPMLLPSRDLECAEDKDRHNTLEQPLRTKAQVNVPMHNDHEEMCDQEPDECAIDLPNVVADDECLVPSAEQNHAIVDQKKINADYSFLGSDKLAPIEVFDDSCVTYIKLNPHNKGIPKIFVDYNKSRTKGKKRMKDKKQLTTIKYRDYLIVNTVEPRLTLEYSAGAFGHKTVELINDSLLQ